MHPSLFFSCPLSSDPPAGGERGRPRARRSSQSVTCGESDHHIRRRRLQMKGGKFSALAAYCTFSRKNSGKVIPKKEKGKNKGEIRSSPPPPFLRSREEGAVTATRPRSAQMNFFRELLLFYRQKNGSGVVMDFWHASYRLFLTFYRSPFFLVMPISASFSINRFQLKNISN